MRTAPPPGPLRSVPPPAAIAGAGILAVLGIGWLDYFTGPDVGLSIFYLMPVVVAGWWGGRLPAAACAVVASGCWLAADLAFRPSEKIAISAWNGFTRLGIYATMGLLTARVRADRDRLRILLEHEAAYARTDALTGLANSRAFLEVVAAEVARSRRSGQPICLAYVDLDNFKRVNDRHGHAAGDDALQRVAGILRESIRATDVAARLGGDEFAVLFWGASRDAVEMVAGRLVERIGTLGQEYADTDLGASAGVGYFAAAPDDPQEVIRRADEAMYEAKRAGKGRICVRA